MFLSAVLYADRNGLTPQSFDATPLKHLRGRLL